MKIHLVVTSRLTAVTALGIGLMLCVSVFAATPKTDATAESEAGLRRPYAYFANGEAVATVLQNLARNFGLTLKISGNFKESISGRVSGDTAADMLVRLSEMYGFNWFIFGNTLYVSRGTDRVVQRIRITPGAADSLKQALTDIGLITARFGWGAVPEEDAVIVSGPREYISLVTAIVAKLETGDSLATMVFRLKYASVEDRRIQLRDKEVVTRGIASILSGLLTRQPAGKTTPGNPPSGGTSFPGQPLAASPGKLSEGTGSDSAKPQQGDSSRGNANGPMIESDPRLNAIIIRDHASKQKMYADLIAELDVPSQLVEIEATIIDIKQEKLDAIGTNWSYGSGRFGIVSSPSGDNAGFGMRFGSGDSTSVVQDLRGFNATLRLLESSGDAKVLAKPVVLTIDNLGAILDLTDTTFSSVSGERVANIVPVTVGTLLRVTPHVIQEDTRTRIQLAVDIEDGTQQPPTGASVARVKKTNISTQAIIEPTQSLLIAGYSLEKDESGTSGIPLLGKLPIVGPLFSTRSNSTTRVKRLFLITPRVITPDQTATSSLSLPELTPKVSFNMPTAPAIMVTEPDRKVRLPPPGAASVTTSGTRTGPGITIPAPKKIENSVVQSAIPESVQPLRPTTAPHLKVPAPAGRLTAFSMKL